MKPIVVEEISTTTVPKTKFNRQWWNLDRDTLHESLFALVGQIETQQTYRKAQNFRNARLYSNQEVFSLQAALSARPQADLFATHRVTLNAVKSCVDTVAAKISKAKPRPMFLTENGDEGLQRKAKLLTQYMEGAFEEMDLYNKMQRAFRDAEIFGTGEIKFFKEDNRVNCERTIIDEIIIDDAEALYGEPKQKHQSRYMNRDVLMEIFPKQRDAIARARSSLVQDVNIQGADAFVRVIESWKLPSGPGSKDGMHVICIDTATLMAERWAKDHFPSVTLRWNERISGYFGSGIPEELTGIQLEINKLMRNIQIAQHLVCVPRIWVENNSMVNTGALTNEIGGIGRYSGSPPTVSTWPGMPPEVYNHVENLWNKAFQQVGVSQLSASSQKPAGLNSGIALREYQEVESDRFQLVGQRYEQAFINAAKVIVELSRELAEEGKDPFVKVKDGKTIKRIKWKDVDLKNDQFDMRVFPTSILPTTPAGKLQTVQELTQAGFIDKDMAMSLLDFPDLESFMSLQNAAVDEAKLLVEKILDDSEYIPPEPYMNLSMTKKIAQHSYLRARVNNVEEEKLQLLRNLMDDCDALLQASQQQMQPQQQQIPTQAPENISQNMQPEIGPDLGGGT